MVCHKYDYINPEVVKYCKTDSVQNTFWEIIFTNRWFFKDKSQSPEENPIKYSNKIQYCNP